MAFAVWLTGLPASGKSSITRALVSRLAARGVAVEVLESDEARRFLTPQPTYSPSERDLLYRALVYCGTRLVAHGTHVIFDATANHRVHRELARAGIPGFLEVLVECPLAVCQARDFKGTYRKGATLASTSVPGLQDPYQPPLHPDVVLDTTKLTPDAAAALVVELLDARGWLS